MDKLFKLGICLLVISCSQKKMTSKSHVLTEKVFYDFTLNSSEGIPIKMDTYKGSVVLMVNTATKCGLAPQFEELQLLHEKYHDQGLVILGVPSNQFLSQEPNSNEEMVEVCKKNHGVTFQLFEKCKVNGDDAIGLYKFLREFNSEEHGHKIRWNFEKFLINREGEVIKRFKPKTKPLAIEEHIKEAL